MRKIFEVSKGEESEGGDRGAAARPPRTDQRAAQLLEGGGGAARKHLCGGEPVQRPRLRLWKSEKLTRSTFKNIIDSD